MKWISVKERLPQVYENVLVLFIYDDIPTCDVAHLNELNNNFSPSCEFAEDTWDPHMSIDNVTHWMPLPELPNSKTISLINEDSFLCDPDDSQGNTTKHCCMSKKKQKNY